MLQLFFFGRATAEEEEAVQDLLVPGLCAGRKKWQNQGQQCCQSRCWRSAALPAKARFEFSKAVFFGATTFSATTFSPMTFSPMTFSLTTFSTTTFSTTTFSTTTVSKTVKNTTPVTKQLTLFKSSLLLKNYLQTIQTLKLNSIGNYLQK